MKEILRYKPELEKHIIKYLDSREKDLGKVTIWGKDSLEKFKDYVPGGKLIRGCLIVAMADLFSGGDAHLIEESYKAAAALEIFQSSILMHDDIFDRDDLRRGKDAMHFIYRKLGDKKKFSDPKHFGESMATCVGDMGFFMCMDLLASMDIDSYSKENIIALFGRESSYMAAAEMHDIYLENIDSEYDLDDILAIYKFKTARYTFSMPMMIGAMIANSPKNIVETLEKIGENLGIIFQIKDDELGLYSDVADIGKSVGIDIRDNKKTIYQYLLYSGADDGRLAVLNSIFGNKNINLEDIDRIRHMIKSSGVYSKVEKMVEDYCSQTNNLIENIECSNHIKHLIKNILAYNLERSK